MHDAGRSPSHQRTPHPHHAPSLRIRLQSGCLLPLLFAVARARGWMCVCTRRVGSAAEYREQALHRAAPQPLRELAVCCVRPCAECVPESQALAQQVWQGSQPTPPMPLPRGSDEASSQTARPPRVAPFAGALCTAGLTARRVTARLPRIVPCRAIPRPRVARAEPCPRCAVPVRHCAVLCRAALRRAMQHSCPTRAERVVLRPVILAQ